MGLVNENGGSDSQPNLSPEELAIEWEIKRISRSPRSAEIARARIEAKIKGDPSYLKEITDKYMKMVWKKCNSFAIEVMKGR